MRNSSVLAFLAVVLSGCGLTDPVPTLVVSGSVVAASDGGGFVSGDPIGDADVVLRYVSPLNLSAVIRDQVRTGADGAYRVETPPPAGQRDINCSTLTVVVTRNGFTTRSVRLSTVAECDGAGTLDLDVALTPNP